MSPIIRAALLVFLILVASPALLLAIPNTIFTYQGELKDDGTPVDASDARMLFRLWSASAGGDQLGPDCEVYPVEIVDGLFTAWVDFGEAAFGEDLRFLEIGVDVTGGTSYEWFPERQMLTATPLAILALNALHGGDTPWQLNGTAVYYLDGPVGIGTDHPASNLQVHGDSGDPVFTAQHDDEWGGTAIHARVIGHGGTALHAQAMGNSENYGLLSEVSSSNSVAVMAENYDTDGGTGIQGTSSGASGYGVVGIHQSSTGTGYGVWARSLSPDGYAGYFRGRGYFENEVGIGTTNPGADLDVVGTIRTDGFKLDTAPAPGYVLTSDGAGFGSWQPTTGSGGLWQSGVGDDIYYDNGNVGIGLSGPSTPLEVYSPGFEAAITGRSGAGTDSGTGVHAIAEGEEGAGLHAEARAADGEAPAVLAETVSGQSYAIHAVHNHAIDGTAIHANAYAELGIGVAGIHSETFGRGKGIFGRSLSPEGYGGYFMGRGYFGGPLGIGTETPSTELEVDGTAKMTGFQLDNTPVAGHVLTSDASGVGTWQEPAGSGPWQEGTYGDIYYDGGNVGVGVTNPTHPLHVAGSTLLEDLQVNGTVEILDTFEFLPGAAVGRVLTCDDGSGTASWQPAPSGFELPIDESGSYNGAAFKIHNSSSGINSSAITGQVSSPYAETAAGRFSSTGVGVAVYATAVGNHAIEASVSSGGVALEVTGSGDYGGWMTTTREGATGVYGANLSTGTGLNNYGGHFVSNSLNGKGVFASTSGGQAQAIRAEATGVEAYGAYITSNHIGMRVEGGTRAAHFEGGVTVDGVLTIKEGPDTVMMLGRGLDYAEGFDVTESEAKIEKGSVLVIDAENPGHLTESSEAYDRKVAGIVAGAEGLGSGVRLGGDEFDHDVALAGRVYCKVAAGSDGIEAGDLLTTSDIPGYAMKVKDHSRSQGAVLGKAMEPLEPNTKGSILVLVTLQ